MSFGRALAGTRVSMVSRPSTRVQVATMVVAKDSRIGKKPITVPKGVTVTVAGNEVKVKVSFTLCFTPLLPVGGRLDPV
jgi:hypothetical protein